jgi:hypothetical protein
LLSGGIVVLVDERLELVEVVVEGCFVDVV